MDECLSSGPAAHLLPQGEGRRGVSVVGGFVNPNPILPFFGKGFEIDGVICKGDATARGEGRDGIQVSIGLIRSHRNDMHQRWRSTRTIVRNPFVCPKPQRTVRILVDGSNRVSCQSIPPIQ